MKTLNTLTIVLLFSIMFPLQAIAQGYTPPSRERVETLLEELEDCKTYLTQSENLIKKMEADAGSYTLAEYNTAKNTVENAKRCINARQVELDELRKDYPGWFNSPNATLSLSRSLSITPRKLILSFEAINKKINAVLDRLEALDIPEN